MIVYVVTARADEGRKVKAVFEDRDQAMCCCALCESDYAEIEVVDTEAIKIGGTKKPLAEWLVIINRHGEVIDAGVRYTFNETRRHCWDVDGSCDVRITHGVNVTEDTAKEIALDYWDKLEKKD